MKILNWIKRIPKRNGVKSFSELDETSSVSSAELIETMRDYAEGGWAIYPPTVVNLITRCKPSERELEVLE